MKRINSIFSVNPLVEFFKNDETNKNYILFAEGGIGKTTALLCLNQYYINRACQGEKILPVFIDVKRLDDNKTQPLLHYIYKEYCGKDSDIEVLENLLNDKLLFASEYEIVFLIDGYNEAGYHLKGNIRNEILELKDNTKIRFVVSSRVNEIELQALGFSDLILEGLSDDRIKSILGVEEVNSSLLEILRIPLFMDKFLKTYDKSDFDKINNSGIIRKSHILNSYIEKILNDALKKKSERKDVLDFVINKWLPALAFEMVRNKRFTIECDCPDELFDYKEFIPFFECTQRNKPKRIMSNEDFEPTSICCEDFALIGGRAGKLFFVHHIWRDFFAAKHIINIINAKKLADLEVDLDENIRRFVGELIKKGDKCECDYETKKDCGDDSESSPIEDFLKDHNLTKTTPLSAKATANLVEIMKIARNNSITANFSNLDLTEATFLSCDLQNSKFNNSKLKESCFSPKGHKHMIIDAAFSDNGEWFVSVDYGGNIFVWNLLTDQVQCISSFDVSQELYNLYQIEYEPIQLFIERKIYDLYWVSCIEKYKFHMFVDVRSSVLGAQHGISLYIDCSLKNIEWYITADECIDDWEEGELCLLCTDANENNVDDYEIDGRAEKSYDYNDDIKIFEKKRLIKTIDKNKYGNKKISGGNCGLFATIKNTDIFIWRLTNLCCVKQIFGECQLESALEYGLQYFIALSDGSIRNINRNGVLKDVLMLNDRINELKICQQTNVLLARGDEVLYVIDLMSFEIINSIDCFEGHIFKVEIFEDRIILVSNSINGEESVNNVFYAEDLKLKNEPIATHGRYFLEHLKYEEKLDCFSIFYYNGFCVWDYKNNTLLEYFFEEKLKSFLEKHRCIFRGLIRTNIVSNSIGEEYLSVYCSNNKTIVLVLLHQAVCETGECSGNNTATLEGCFGVSGECIMLTSIDEKIYYADYIASVGKVYVYSIDTLTKQKKIETVYYINSREKYILLHCNGKYTTKYDVIKKHIKIEGENIYYDTISFRCIENVIANNMRPVNMLNTDFSDSVFIGDEKDRKEFYKVLYTNGANVPDEYIPDLSE